MRGTVPIFLHLLKQKRHKWLEMSFEIASKSAGGVPLMCGVVSLWRAIILFWFTWKHNEVDGLKILNSFDDLLIAKRGEIVSTWLKVKITTQFNVYIFVLAFIMNTFQKPTISECLDLKILVKRNGNTCSDLWC